MDINSILAAFGGGSGLAQGSGSGAITAPMAPNVLTPHMQMPQFAGAGTNAGVQSAAAAAARALSAPPQQPQRPGSMIDPSQMGLIAMMMNRGLPATSTPTGTDNSDGSGGGITNFLHSLFSSGG